jgi:hypothetical protein
VARSGGLAPVRTRFAASRRAAGLAVVLLVIPAACLTYLLTRTVARGEGAPTQPVSIRPRVPMAPPTVRSWSAIRRAAGWRGASLRQRFWAVLSVLCAMSFLAGLTFAVAGVGQPGLLTPGPPLSPMRAATASRARAAAWIAQQVSPDVTVLCDPEMCGQVQKSGFPASRLRALRRAPGGSLGSGVVVSTPALRDQFGARLAAVYAPLVIASFGSGAERVDVRAVAPNGAAAFRSQLASEHTYRISAGSQLVRNKDIQASPAARAALRAGRVDFRLFATLSVLASEMPVRLVAFDDLPPGASSAVPLRGAEIGAASPAALSAILAFLHAQRAPYLPAVAAITRSASGQSLVTVRFDALGLMPARGP